MADNDNNLARIMAQREAEIRQHAGSDEFAQGAIKGIERMMTRSDPAHLTGADPLTQAGLMENITRPDNAGRMFSDGIASAPEEDWRKWRDSQPRRRERINRAR
jgi:hypothetical protein